MSSALRIAGTADTRTLLPRSGDQLEVETQGPEVEVRWRDRRYLLPAEDVVLLPMPNVSIELLAEYLWQQLAADFQGEESNAGTVEELEVSVEETAGQWCSRWGRVGA